MIEQSKQILLWGIKIILERYFNKSLDVSIPDPPAKLSNALLGENDFVKSNYENGFFALRSIFSNLKFCEKPGLSDNQYLHPNPDFELSSIIYPTADKKLNPQLWKKDEVLHELKTVNQETDDEQLLNLLYKYGSRLPIFDAKDCTLPIYDAVKILAALATSEKDEYRLVIGDLSGIQDFIYTINPEGSLKVLRARSFYLELLTKSLAYDICEDNNVTSANILFSGGGNFLMVLPENDELSAKLETYYKNVNSFFLIEFEGNLHMPIASVSFSLEELKSIRAKWTELYQKLDQAKRQKFYNLLQHPYDEARPVQQDECLICHTDAENADIKEFLDAGVTKKICDFCDRLKKFGASLKDLSYVYGVKSDEKKDGLYIPSIKSGYHWYYELGKPKRNDRLFQVNKINPDANIAIFYADYVTEEVVKGRKRAQDFEDLSKYSIGSDLIATLAMDVDNMGLIFSDGIHTPPEQPQHFLIMTHVLSQNLDYFFKFALKQDILANPDFCACDNLDKFKKAENRKVSVVYSGGDDLLLVGAWSDVLECAFDVHQSFEKYTCHNSDIGLSGGIYVSQPNFPFYIAVKKAQAGEKLAKDNYIDLLENEPGIYQGRDYSSSKIYDKRKNKLKLKDSITMFYDDTLHFLVKTMPDEEKKDRYLLTARWSEMTKQLWDNPDHSVEKHLKMFISNQLAEFVEDEKRVKFEFPRSFISKLYQMVDRYRNEKDGVLYLIDLVYSYSRLNRELFNKLKPIYNLYNRPDIKTKNYIIYLPIILNWLELLLRKKGEK